MKTNVKKATTKTKAPAPTTHGGAPTTHLTYLQELKRSTSACMLWEDEFYEDGVSISLRIKECVAKVAPELVSNLAIELREKHHLRHIPLFLAVCMAELATHKHLVRELLPAIIQRPDELSETLAIYWKDGKRKITAQIKRGLADAYSKFSEYQLSKWNKDGAITLLDVMKLVHPKPRDTTQCLTFAKLHKKELRMPDTHEKALSAAGPDEKLKKSEWERLLKEHKVPAMALFKNLANMEKYGVSKSNIEEAIVGAKTEKLLPFRFISAAKHAPRFEESIEKAMLASLSDQEKIPGKTILIVDVSGSMYTPKVSAKSEITRAEAGCALAILVKETCEKAVIYATAGHDYTRVHETAIVPGRRGFALSDYIYRQSHPLGGGGIFLKAVMDYVYEKEGEADRIIVITDEQDCSGGGENAPEKANAFGKRNYILNVGDYKHGIGYGKWIHISGFSEAVINYIRTYEQVLG